MDGVAMAPGRALRERFCTGAGAPPTARTDADVSRQTARHGRWRLVLVPRAARPGGWTAAERLAGDRGSLYVSAVRAVVDLDRGGGGGRSRAIAEVHRAAVVSRRGRGRH